MNTFQSAEYWKRMSNYNNLTTNEQGYYLTKTNHILYWLNADRFYWNSDDAQNLAEAFFAMGNVASICRICFLLPIIGFVGPLQVNIHKKQMYFKEKQGWWVRDKHSTHTLTPAKTFMSKYKMSVWVDGRDCMSSIFISDPHTLLFLQRLYFDVLLIYFLRNFFASNFPKPKKNE
jgi:hypothetical protein